MGETAITEAQRLLTDAIDALAAAAATASDGEALEVLSSCEGASRRLDGVAVGPGPGSTPRRSWPRTAPRWSRLWIRTGPSPTRTGRLPRSTSCL